MSKFLRKGKARACPIHTAIYDEAVNRLTLSGVFSKDEILDNLNFAAVEDSIRWDYIREFIEEDYESALVPLAGSYFRRHGKAHEHANPSKFLASGHGKKTAGYAATTPENDHLTITYLGRRKAVADGVANVLKKNVTSITDARTKSGDPVPKEIAAMANGASKPIPPLLLDGEAA